MENYIKKNERICYNMDEPRKVMLSEISQAQEVTYYMILLIWNVQNR